jgi:mono/diheme cytochrome c family protein
MRRLGPALAAIPLTAGPALAQEAPGDPAAGRMLAEEVCAACHVIPGVAPRIRVPGARSFQALAADPAVTGLTLHAYLRTQHPPAPNFVLNEQQLNDVVAYILSLQVREAEEGSAFSPRPQSAAATTP